MNHALGVILAGIAAGVYAVKMFADRDPRTPMAAKVLMITVSIALLFMSAALIAGVVE